MNGASILTGNNCFKQGDRTCIPMTGNGCDSDRIPCTGLDALNSNYCTDTRNTRKCARKVSRNKCHKARVASICRQSCGLCNGVPPPSPRPPPRLG